MEGKIDMAAGRQVTNKVGGSVSERIKGRYGRDS